ncbi:nitrite/sulfite reductase [Sulfurimonas sp.]|jgi:sulfite reductase (ferredoxin)|uniref:nitrite/sulfite reductase n=1 Tax=Sulfurimonas sp. TaxID=2022749 RepID=UPI0025F8BAE2|nr:nitrite/sulfite reductase [Sulfurimonas sp.]MCK9472538.1 nitrite/sulfite reductase [Sulfurimonas sp.]MDD3505915.1 nitrite/sulfite reductase [Sulfurimonas sp.]
MLKETKAKRVERIKIEKDGLDVLGDIHRYAQTGKEIDPEDIDRFKWYGLYTQNRNLQDKDDNTLYFMLRVKLLGGRLDLEGLEAVAEISQRYARGTADFTSRQDIQFHYIKVEDLPTIFKRLEQAGLTTVFAAGDVPRNVVTCPINDVDVERIFDVGTIVKEVNEYFDANKEVSNLPRKYKVGISGCSKHCASHEIQDLSFNATKFQDDKVLFDVSVGGGLASNKRIASHLGYVEAEQVLAVAKAVTEIYKEHGGRENRNRARVGHLLETFGVDKFLQTLHSKLDFSLQKKGVQIYTPYAQRGHFGVHGSVKEGRSYIGCAINGGKIGAEGLYGLLKILRKYEASAIRATISQNFVITDLPSKSAHAAVEKLSAIGIDANPSSFKAGSLSCTGRNFCKYGVSETKDLAIELAEYLEKKFPDFSEPLSFSVNGCPHSCAHPHIVDIGLLGCKVKHKGETVSGFELILGGNLEGDRSNFGRKTGIKFISKDAFKIVESIIESYRSTHYKNFHDYAAGVLYE